MLTSFLRHRAGPAKSHEGLAELLMHCPNSIFTPSSAALTMALYRHPLGENEIRLLTLLPGKRNDTLKCKLHNVSLNNPIAFEALSYVWGDAGLSKPITVQGIAHSITVNLDMALRALRRPRKSRVIWVDALCINQDNVEEKNTQVPLMSNIYSTAIDVIVWLGPSTPGINLFGQWVRTYIITGSCGRCSASWLLRDAAAVFSHRARWKRALMEFRAYGGYLRINRLRYWSRMWTFQEYHLARRHPICLCGVDGELIARAHEIDEAGKALHKLYRATSNRIWDPDFTTGRSDMDKALDDELSRVEPLEDISPIPKREFDDDGFGAPTLVVNLLTFTAERHCLNPLDRIYGIYGMAPAMRAVYPPDYRKTLELVLRETAAYIINHEDVALLLTVFGPRDGALENTALPSWVPNFDETEHQKKRSLHPYVRHLLPANESEDSLVAINHGASLGNLDGAPVASVDDSLTLLCFSARDLGPCRVALRFGHDPSEVLQQLAQWLLNKGNASIPSPLLEHTKQQRIEGVTDEDNPTFIQRMIRLCVSHEPYSVRYTTPELLTALDGNFEMERGREEGWDGMELSELWATVRLAVQGLTGKVLFTTKWGLFGVGLGAIQDGDTLILAPEVPFPLVLRHLECVVMDRPRAQYRFVGTSFVDGLMEPLSIDADTIAKVEKLELEAFNIW